MLFNTEIFVRNAPIDKYYNTSFIIQAIDLENLFLTKSLSLKTW